MDKFTLFNSLPCGICRIGTDDVLTITYANDYFRQMCGITDAPAETGKSFSLKALLHKDDFPKIRAEFFKEQKEQIPLLHTEVRYTDNSGATGWLLFRSRCDRGLPDGLICLVLDITEQKQKEEQNSLYRLDLLTGLFNRRAAIEHINACLSGCPEESYAFIMVDLDCFKQLNDTYGHLAGDAVLSRIASDIKSLLSPSDIACRLGGDEFLLFLHNLSSAGLPEEKLIALQKVLSDTEYGIQMSGSIGAALYPRDGKDFESLYSRADIALYQAKHLGKNRYVFYENGLKMPPAAQRQAPPKAATHSAKSLPARRLEQYRSALDNTYDELFELNVTNNAYRLVLHTPHKYTMPPDEGVLSTELENVAFHMIYPYDRQRFLDFFDIGSIRREFSCGNKSISSDFRKLLEIGEYAWASLTLVPFSDDSGQEIYLCFVSDINQKKRIAEQDIVTGYINYDRFKEEAQLLLESPECESKHYALTYSDLKNFKFINDIYGYDTGDYILRYWADLVYQNLLEGESFARMAADHFVVLHRSESQEELVNRILVMVEQLRTCSESFGRHFPIEPAVGIYFVEADQHLSFDDMLNRANLAQKSAKSLSGSHVAVYTEDMRKEILREKLIESEMEEALERREFCVYLQPIVDIQHGNTVAGLEALVRWQHPTRGLLMPGYFIPVFEKNGFIVQLDRYVYEEVCCYLRRELDAGKQPAVLSVNVSRVSVFQEDFIDYYTRIKETYDIPDGLLELECTETTAAKNPQALNKIIDTMRSRGFHYSMDDFGSGYSSLNLLKDLTVDVLKLDMGFFSNGFHGKRERAIISCIIAMAQSLDMKVVAEGIEAPGPLSLLRNMGCNYVQGYIFSKPYPIPSCQESPQAPESEGSQNERITSAPIKQQPF